MSDTDATGEITEILSSAADHVTSDNDLEGAELAEELLQVGRAHGIALAFQGAAGTAREAHDVEDTSRWRRAWRALRGRDPDTGRDTSEFDELAEFALDVNENLEDHTEALQEDLADRLETSDQAERMFQ